MYEKYAALTGGVLKPHIFIHNIKICQFLQYFSHTMKGNVILTKLVRSISGILENNYSLWHNMKILKTRWKIDTVISVMRKR